MQSCKSRVLSACTCTYMQLRKVDGSLYNRKSLACIARGLQRHLNAVYESRKQHAYETYQSVQDIPRHQILVNNCSPAFAAFQRNLDGAMRRSTRAGQGYTRKARALHPEELKGINDMIGRLPDNCAKVCSDSHRISQVCSFYTWASFPSLAVYP